MRIFTYFCFLAIIAGLSTGCIRKQSDKAQVTSQVLFSGVNYPEMTESCIVKLSKSDFTTGKIRSIEQIPLDMIIENRELDIYIKGNFLLVKHLEMREGAHLLHVVSLPDYKVVAKLAPFGEGPNEFADIRVINTEETDKLCYIRDCNKKQLSYLSNSLELKECGKLVEIPNFTGQKEGSLYLGNNHMLVNLDSGDGMGICVVNQKDSTIRGIIPFHFEEGAHGYFYIGNLAYSFAKRRGAHAFIYHDRIAFFDFEGKNRKMVRFGDNHLRTLTSPGNPIYYYSCFGSDKYVYAIFRVSKTDADQTNPLYLEQFDWDGNPVARYLLPEGRGLFSGCATDNDSVIYLVDYYEDHFLHKVVLSKN